jgi:hypothetical protein
MDTGKLFCFLYFLQVGELLRGPNTVQNIEVDSVLRICWRYLMISLPYLSIENLYIGKMASKWNNESGTCILPYGCVLVEVKAVLLIEINFLMLTTWILQRISL